MSRNNAVRAFWLQSIDNRKPVTEEQLSEIKARFCVAGGLQAVAGADGYAVSDDGRVFSAVPCSWMRNPLRLLKATRLKNGHLVVRLHVNKKSKSNYIHRLVAIAFLPPPSEGQTVVRHLDGDPLNNQVGNLAWGSQEDNCGDTARHGRVPHGIDRSAAKLNDDIVKASRLLAGQGISCAAISRLVGISEEPLRRAISGLNWQHVVGEQKDY